jgi:hypothetical protein
MKPILTLAILSLSLSAGAQGIRLSVNGGNQSDTLYLPFNPGATIGQDVNDRVINPVSGNGHNYIFTDAGNGTRLDLNNVPQTDFSYEVPVAVFVQNPGYADFTLEADPSIPANTLFVLEDIAGGQMITLAPGVPAQQYLLSNNLSDPAGYKLHVFPAPVITTTAPVCQASADGIISISFGNSTNWTANFYDSGNTLLYVVTVAGHDTTLPIFTSDLYTVKFSSGGPEYYSEQAMVNFATPLDATFILSTDTIYSGQQVPFVNQATAGQSYTWNFGDSSGNYYGYQPSFYYNTPGDYEIAQLVTSNEGCLALFTMKVEVLPGLTTGTGNNDWHDPKLSSSDGILRVENISANAVVTVYSADGKLIAVEQSNGTSCAVSLAAQNIYLVTVVDNGKLLLSAKTYINGL